MKTAIYAGSFDPFTKGHLDILKRGSQIFDRVIIAVANNIEKQSFLPVEVRLNLIEECIKDLNNVEVDAYDGLTVEFAQKSGAQFLLRGIRSSADYEYEAQLSQINKSLYGEIETVFIISNPQYSFISSSAVREIYKNKGDFSDFVPQPVAKYLIEN